jgi:UDP-N-acetylmuramoyl-tripeptide--D-alanyl-D-alanine ligase
LPGFAYDGYLTPGAGTGYWRRGWPEEFERLKIRIGNIPFISPALQRALDRREAGIAQRAARRRPKLAATFIGVTGSSAKSTTSALLSHILASAGEAHGQYGPNSYKVVIRTLARMAPGTEFVVAECGAHKPGSIAEMAELLRPDMAIVTLVALEHKSAFHTIEAVAAEKGALVASLPAGGTALLNADDPLVMAMAERTTARVLTFGRNAEATYRASEVAAAFPQRLSLTVSWPGGELPLRTRFVAEHFWLPTVAAVAAALELGLSPDAVAARVATFEPLGATGNVIETPDGVSFVLDTRKAPWHSIPLFLDAVAKTTARRRRLVLGHMSDYRGSNTRYGQVYDMARNTADEIIFIGSHRHRARATQQELEEGRFHAFETPREARDYLKATAAPGDVIFLKGSSDLHLERLGMAFESDVRCWVTACGKAQSCYECGRYLDSYDWHKGRKNRFFKKLLARLGLKPASRGALRPRG